MFSHTSIVPYGTNEYIREISGEECRDLHHHGSFSLGNGHIIQGIKVNSTVTHPLILAGSLTNEGSCSGTQYSDPFGTWNNVVAQGTIKITIRSHTARISLNNNKIHLDSGVSCIFSDGSCLDFNNGYSYWTTLPNDHCKFDRYTILY